MKRIIAVLLAISMICSGFAAFAADTETKISDSASILTDLGIISDYEADAEATRADVVRFLEVLNGVGSYEKYFESYTDMASPVLYGQLLMILVDVAGYTPFFAEYNMDSERVESYAFMAQKMGLKKMNIGAYTTAMSMEDYAAIIYSALTDVKPVRTNYFSNGGTEFYIDSKGTLMDDLLKLEEISGVVTGVGETSLDSRETGEKGRLAINGKWYKFDTAEDTYKYLGMYVRALVGEADDEKVLRSVIIDDKNNKVLELEAIDIMPETVSLTSLTYQKTGEKKKTISIDKEADMVYNRRLFPSFTKDEMTLGDCSYKYIDNNGDSRYDVIIADYYDVFMLQSILADKNTLIDTKSRVYDLDEYFMDGKKMYDADGILMTFDDLNTYNIISYQVAKDGEYTSVVISSAKETGIINSVKNNWQSVVVSGEKYNSLESYYKHRADYDKVNVGDEAEIFFDFRGYIADIKPVSSFIKTGYLLGMAEQPFGGVKVKLVNEEGKEEIADISGNVTVDGEKRSASTLKSYTPLYENGAFKDQLIQYRQSANGRIYWLDTAENKSGIGSRNNEGFTLDYDSETSQDLRALSINGSLVIGSKYMPDADSKLFGINKKKETYYVRPANSLGVNTALKLKIYNVDEDYVPEFVVIMTGTSTASQVDSSQSTMIVDHVEQEYDPETDGAKYRLYYYNGSGSYNSNLMIDETITHTPSNIPLVDSRFGSVQFKDLQPGTIIQTNTVTGEGFSGFAIQFIPMKDDSEKIAENKSYNTGWNYGLDEYMFNSNALFSYGKVLRRVPNALIVNNHMPTEREEAMGLTFPIESWNRTIPINGSTFVWFFDKDEEKLEKGTAAGILEGDMIFMHRQAANIQMIVVYR